MPLKLLTLTQAKLSRPASTVKGGKVLEFKTQDYLSTEQVAKWLGFAPRTITHWTQKWDETGGKEGIPGFKIGRSWRFEKVRIEQWLLEQKQMSSADQSVA